MNKFTIQNNLGHTCVEGEVQYTDLDKLFFKHTAEMPYRDYPSSEAKITWHTTTAPNNGITHYYSMSSPNFTMFITF